MLAQDRHAEDRSHRGIDVRDHGCPDRPHFGDQREEDEERKRGADDGQADHRLDHVCRRHLGRPAERGKGRVQHRGDQKRRGDDTERRNIVQPTREDDRADRVTDRDAADLGDRERVHLADVEPDESGDAADPDEQPEPAAAALALARSGERDDHGTDERHGCDQQPGEGARQLRLRTREEDPRDHHLDHRVGEQRPPAREERSQLARAGPRTARGALPRSRCGRRRASPVRARGPRRGSSDRARPR